MVRPNLLDAGSVLDALKATPLRAALRAGLDHACARRMSREQAGTKERPSARTKELMR
jgi:hypothetical protein